MQLGYAIYFGACGLFKRGPVFMSPMQVSVSRCEALFWLNAKI